MPPATVYPGLDDEPIVPANTKRTTHDSKGETTAMEPVTTTLRRKEQPPIADDDREEMEMDSFDNKKEQEYDDNKPTDERLSEKDRGNFALLVILCRTRPVDRLISN